MKKLFIATLVLGMFITSCTREKPWQPLFNGMNLENWDMHVGTPLKGFDSLALTATAEKLFSVVPLDGENVIRISGEVNGSLATRESFENYHLRLVYKWGEKVYTSRNSGLLYHSTGNFGAALGTWMTNIECQLMQGNLGDTYLMNNTVCETEAVKNETTGNFVYTPGAPLLPFGEKSNGRSVKKVKDAEKPAGEWNTVELYSVGRTTVHVVNGTPVMVNNATGLANGDAINPLTSGKIQLQSEGAELYVKSIEIQPVSKIPKNIVAR